MSRPDAILEGLPPPRGDEPANLRRDIADEIADHLACSALREWRRGAGSEDEALGLAYERFGDAVGVARCLWWDAMKGQIMRDRVLMIGVAVLVVLCGVMVFMTWSMASRQQEVTAQLLTRLASAPAPGVSMDWTTLAVRLVDAQGQPLPDCFVEIEGKLYSEQHVTLRDDTKNDGRITFGPIRTGVYVVLSVVGREGYRYQQMLIVPPGREVEEIVVQQPATPPKAQVTLEVEWPDESVKTPVAVELHSSAHAPGWSLDTPLLATVPLQRKTDDFGTTTWSRVTTSELGEPIVFQIPVRTYSKGTLTLLGGQEGDPARLISLRSLPIQLPNFTPVPGQPNVLKVSVPPGIMNPMGGYGLAPGGYPGGYGGAPGGYQGGGQPSAP